MSVPNKTNPYTPITNYSNQYYPQQSYSNMSTMNNMYPYYNYNYGGQNLMYNTNQVNPYYYQYPNVNTITTNPETQIGGLNNLTTNPQTQISNMTPEEYQLYMQQYQQMLIDPNYYSKLYSSYGMMGVGKTLRFILN